MRLDEIDTHSFIKKEIRLLSYVQDRTVVDIDKAEMDFSIYEKDVLERHIRIARLQDLYEKKRMKLSSFQKGRDIWKNNRY